MPTLSEGVLERYERFSLYNSPYAAHDRGCAVDLYPEAGPHRATSAPSPVAGEVLDTRSVRAPPKEYAAEQDHLVLVEVDPEASGFDVPEGTVARTLHVDPSVDPGDRVEVGDSLGTLVRAGFFAPWVDNHIHLGFRAPDANPYRAAGSLPLDVAVDVEPLSWDGRGTVRETGETYLVIDAPTHPAPGERFVGIAAEGSDGSVGVLDGGLVHYDGGGLHGGPDGLVSLFGERVGVAEDRTVTWDPLAVFANGERCTGLSLFCARDERFGAKVVAPGHGFAVGDEVRVTVEGTDDPTVLS
ncbi:hypothetical protein [Halomarina litorea]|uniref:hypothetical protein n=1 Tax=Halomarina litorea TaxID=2961595 RepID=UPI0020C28A39|nr:hypothetical protein [Halomarina sp. BCD28]